MAVDIGPRIGIDGEKEFRQELQNINQQLRTLGSEMKAVTSSFDAGARSEEALAAQTDVLNRQIDAQRQKLQQLQRGLDAAADKYGVTDTKTLKWAQAVNDARADLNRLESQLKSTTGEVDDYGDAVDGASSATGGLGGLLGSSGLGGILSKGLGVGAVVGGITAITSAITGLVDETQEYRRVMGALEASSDAAGYSAEQTSETYEQLYRVLGDNQTAATATANLQAVGLAQKDLYDMTELVIGAWARYGDSIPIDSLAESVNETIRAGQVTGTFADVLNWGSREGETFGVTLRESTEANKEWNDSVLAAESAEDYFNLALQECSTQAERADLVMQAMAGQGLSQVAEGYHEVNAATEDANSAQAEYEEAQAGLAERLLPVKTALTQLASGGFDLLSSAIDGVVGAIKDLNDWWDEVQPKLEKGWDEFWGTSAKVYKNLGNGKYGWVDGSHAQGLDYVPWDGYIAQLHKGEMILPEDQARALRESFLGAVTPNTGLRDTIHSAAAGMVNGMAAISGSQRIVVEVPVIINGKEFFRTTLDDLRAVQKSNPEVAKA